MMMCWARILFVIRLLAIIFMLGATSALADGPVLSRLKAHFQQQEDDASSGPSKNDRAQGAVFVQLARLNVAIWQPRDMPAAPLPLVIFSHGFSGCKTQSVFLMRALADDGYIVAAPDHADASCGGTVGRFPHVETSFKDAKDWTDKTYIARENDIKTLYAALKADKTWGPHIDWTRVGLAGHSLGGYTVLALAGAWPSWKMDGIKAVLALSPYCTPFIDHGALGDMKVPVMYQGGTRDMGITPFVKKPGGAYDKTSSPAWFVEFDKTGHFGWTDLMKATQPQIIDYSLWFFDRALKGIDAPAPHDDGVADFRSK